MIVQLRRGHIRQLLHVQQRKGRGEMTEWGKLCTSQDVGESHCTSLRMFFVCELWSKVAHLYFRPSFPTMKVHLFH